MCVPQVSNPCGCVSGWMSRRVNNIYTHTLLIIQVRAEVAAAVEGLGEGEGGGEGLETLAYS